MADGKITADPNLASPAAGDLIPIVDIDVADSLKNKTITWSQIPAGTVTAVTAGTGLASTGGTTPVITPDFVNLTLSGTLVGSDELVSVDGTASRRSVISNIPLSIFNNDLSVVDLTTAQSIGGDKTFTGTRIEAVNDTGAYSATNTDTNALLRLENNGNTDADAVGISFINHSTNGSTKGCAIKSERSSTTASELVFITSHATTPAERMRITSDGNVIASGAMGIGVATAPQRPLHVIGDDGPVGVWPTVGAKDGLIFENNNNSNIGIILGTGFQFGFKIYEDGAASFNGVMTYTLSTETWDWGTGGTNGQMKLDSSGNLTLIGNVYAGNTLLTTDNQLYMGSQTATSAKVNFDSNDWLQYDRTANEYGFYINAAKELGLTGTEADFQNNIVSTTSYMEAASFRRSGSTPVAGAVRLLNTDVINWRNALNTSDIGISVLANDSFDFKIAGTTEFNLSASTANFQNNTISTTGTISCGALNATANSTILTTGNTTLQLDTSGGNSSCQIEFGPTQEGYIGYWEGLAGDNLELGVAGNTYIQLTGSSGTNPGDFVFRSTGALDLHYDASLTLWDFQANDISTTGTLTLGAGVKLSESAHRPDLLRIESQTASWAGLQIDNTAGETLWNLMADGTALTIYDDTSNAFMTRWYDGGATEIYYAGSIKLATSNTGVDVTGDVDLTGNVICASGQGIDFSASTNASGMTSELLDDYEEGTFAPTFTGSTSGTYTAATGFTLLAYTKVGQVVHIQGRIRIDAESSPVGRIRMTLPFTVGSGSETEAVSWIPLQLWLNGSTLAGQAILACSSGFARGDFYTIGLDGVLANLDQTMVDTDWYVHIEGSYIAA